MGKKTAKAGIIGLIMGAIAGVFLLAPKSAKENRQDLKNAAAKAKLESEKKLKELYSELSSRLDVVSKEAKTRASVEKQRLIATGEEVKGRLKNAISVLHEGNEDIAEDVKILAQDAKKVLASLKQAATKK